MRDWLLNRILTAHRRVWRLVHRFTVLSKPMNHYLTGELGRVNRELLALQCATKAGVPTYHVKDAFRRGAVWFIRLRCGAVHRMSDFIQNPPRELRWTNSDGVVKAHTVSAG